MNDALLFFFLLLLVGCQPNSNPGVKISKAPTNSIAIIQDDYSDAGYCMYEKSDKDLLTTYPFSKADRIEVVSYPMRKSAYLNSTLIINNKFIVKGIEDRIKLTDPQIDTLFSILFNYKLKSDKYGMPITDCYTPRHSILFYKNNKVFAFYEICFDCGGTRQTKDVDFGEFCIEKKCKLQKFFRSVGIKHEIMDDLCL